MPDKNTKQTLAQGNGGDTDSALQETKKTVTRTTFEAEIEYSSRHFKGATQEFHFEDSLSATRKGSNGDLKHRVGYNITVLRCVGRTWGSVSLQVVYTKPLLVHFFIIPGVYLP